MNLIAKIRYGSHLYGTSTPESDEDWRYVYLPTLEDCLLNRVKHSFVAKDEEDGHYFGLQEFLRLASEGQSIALEMIHAPLCLETHPIWSKLCVNAHRFHTKNMDSFIGFARTMSGKYSMRIDRLNETEAILATLNLFNETEGVVGGREGQPFRLEDAWDDLPESLNAIKTVNERNAGAEKRVYQVCGRELQATVTIAHAKSVVKAIYDSYGERVRKAKDGNIDFKSLSHAFRAALQCREIVDTGNLVFPLKDAEWLREVKLGHVDFFTNSLDKRLDDLIAEVSDKMAKSNLPEKVDQKWVDDLIIDAYRIQEQTEWFKRTLSP